MEKDLEKKIVKDLESIGCFVSKFIDQSRKGAPDRLIFTPMGNVYMIETKTKNGVLSKHQIEYHDELRKRRVRVNTICSYEQWESLFKMIQFLETLT